MTIPQSLPQPPSPQRWRFFVAEREAWAFVVAAALIALLALGLRLRDVVLYNGSPSLPVGFYLRIASPIERGAIVTVEAADVAYAYAKTRDFVDKRDRFIKRVAGVEGDQVCAEGDRVTLNGAVVATRRERDASGRVLPHWSGCRVLREDELFLLGDTADSFDGRYWGVVRASEIEGAWRRLF